MNKRQRKVFALLKTKTKALGFNRKELEGLALKIDKNLELEEDASDEDVDAAIETAVEAALPFLEVSQSVAQRSIQTSLQRMRAQQGNEDDDENDDDSDDDGQNDDVEENRQRGKSKNRKSNSSSEDSELMRLLKEQSEAIKSLKGQIDTMQGDRVHESRRTKLKKLVEDTGTFGKSVLKQFDHMTFKDDESFDDYLDEVQKDLDDLNQERANEGLKKLGDIPAGKGHKSNEKNKYDELSDDEVIALAGGKKETK